MTNRGILQKKSPCSGFTLTELMIVILSATVLTAAAVPGVNRLHEEWELWCGARMLEGALQRGRMHAVWANAPVLFTVDNDRAFYWADATSGEPHVDSIQHLPAGLSLVSYPRRPLRFYPHGNAAPAGTYTIQGSTGSYSVVVSPGGRIRVQKN